MTAVSASTPEDGVEPTLDKARLLLQQGRLDAAAATASAVLEKEPQSRDALYLLAVAERYRGRIPAAHEALDRLEEVDPGYGRAAQERGHLLAKSEGRAADALAAYERAVRLNPTLGASWQAIAECAAALGKPELAQRASAHLRRLEATPRELVSVESFIHEGRLLKAETLARAFLQQNPRHVEGMRLLAQLGLELGVLDDAEFLLATALELEPDFLPARIDYVRVLQARQKYARALEEAEKVRAADPENPALALLHANQLAAVGRYEEALARYDELAPRAPEMAAQIAMARGHALKTVGGAEATVEAYRAAARARPDFGDAYWSLANLKTYRFTDAELDQMQAMEAAPGTALVDRYHLCFALGKAFEDRGEPEPAMAFYTRGNALKKAELRYDADRMQAEFDRQKSTCTKELFAAHQGEGHAAPDPIFILGLPRAGSTLIEQILAAHPQVDGTLELPNILAMAHRLGGRRKVGEPARYPDILHELPAERLAELGRGYVDDVAVYRQGAPFFTDKMPNNFRHIGLIHLILPNARIIDARRHPLSCCFSGFKQLFAEGQEFTYGLEEIGRYYRGYVDLMAHWDRVLPGRVLRVIYEDVVADLEAEVRRLLDFCGLPFDPACLEFHEAKRAVRTASAEQVRQPLYTSGLEPWRPFEPWLDPLKDALGPALTHWRA